MPPRKISEKQAIRHDSKWVNYLWFRIQEVMDEVEKLKNRVAKLERECQR